MMSGLVNQKPSGAAKTSSKAFQTEANEHFVGFATSSTDIKGGSDTQQFLYEDLVKNSFSLAWMRPPDLMRLGTSHQTVPHEAL